MEYALNTQDARKADQRGGFINETGKYIGQFTRAEDIKTDKGTSGIDFSFVANDGRKARFALYTTKGDGSKIGIGHGFVMALMTCLKLRGMKPALMRVRKWDAAAGQEAEVQAPCFGELMNKPVGVLLEKEIFQKDDGSEGSRMVLAGVFQAETELMASEILDNKVRPEQLSKVVETLRDRRAKPQGGKSAGRPANGASGWDDMSDDIPFADPYKGRFSMMV
jgi:hypothetical protein